MSYNVLTSIRHNHLFNIFEFTLRSLDCTHTPLLITAPALCSNEQSKTEVIVRESFTTAVCRDLRMRPLTTCKIVSNHGDS